MITKISNENGLVELRQLEGNKCIFKVSPDQIDLDISGLAYDGKARMVLWLDLLRDMGSVWFPVKDNSSFMPQPKEAEGAAEYVVVPHSIGDGGGPYLAPILAVRTFDGRIYADMRPLCS